MDQVAVSPTFHPADPKSPRLGEQSPTLAWYGRTGEQLHHFPLMAQGFEMFLKEFQVSFVGCLKEWPQEAVRANILRVLPELQPESPVIQAVTGLLQMDFAGPQVILLRPIIPVIDGCPIYPRTFSDPTVLEKTAEQHKQARDLYTRRTPRVHSSGFYCTCGRRVVDAEDLYVCC